MPRPQPARLMAPRPTPLDRLVDAPRQVRGVVTIYRRTPPRLRRPEPAIRLGVSVAAVWFTVLFASLSAALARTPQPATRPLGIPAAAGFGIAALLGTLGLALFLTRRQRAGLYTLGSMLALAQITALAVAL